MNKIIIALLVVFGLFTLMAGIYFPISATAAPLTIRLVFLSLLLIDAILYFIAAWGIGRKIDLLFYPTIMLLALNILGLIFDDLGWINLGAGVYNLLIIILLIANRRQSARVIKTT